MSQGKSMRAKIIMMFAALSLAAPATAQLGGSRGDEFLKAVREVDGNKATELLSANGSTVLSARGGQGEGAMHIVTQRRDLNWLAFLLSRGADADAADSRGETPLLITARLGWEDGAKLLLDTGARVDGTNRLGETALIVAVQSRQAALARLLLSRGANPDKADHAAGYTARDYAKRDNRSAEFTRLIETVKPSTRIIAGPIIK